MSLDVAIERQQGAFTLECAFTAPAGITALFGVSGAGKTTVLKAIAGLVTPDSGHIRLGERTLFDAGAKINAPIHTRRIGYVFQDARLFPHLTVAGNLRYGARKSADVSAGDVETMAEFLGLHDKLRRKPSGLSGGEAQRVAIGRALMSKPSLLLMDEPLSGLDENRRTEVLGLIERLQEQTGVPILYVSHAKDEVVRLAETVVVLANGRVQQEGRPDLLLEPSSAGATSHLPARLVAKNASDGLSELSVPGGRLLVPQVDAPLGAQMSVGIASRDVIIARERPSGLSALNILPAVVAAIEEDAGDAGPSVRLVLMVGDAQIEATITRRSRQLLELAPGQSVYAIIKAVALGQTSGAVATVEI
ncbi:MAG: molybdenum ABC transporter ATP-binding protein [Devosiaceae bacterium]|nr:molybdenum ABC transporter ATP-binding protein [Devosiaceae bacterium MH13]